jgi:hypothetical protein
MSQRPQPCRARRLPPLPPLRQLAYQLHQRPWQVRLWHLLAAYLSHLQLINQLWLCPFRLRYLQLRQPLPPLRRLKLRLNRARCLSMRS